jgi:hypothetical protein
MASTYLTRTFGSSGSQQTATFSVWVKRSALGGGGKSLFGYDVDANNFLRIGFKSSDELVFRNYNGGVYTWRLETNRKFRDTSAWYHIVFEVDSTQSTSSDRLKLYVNGVQETSFSTATYPSQNANMKWGNNAYAHIIGDATGGDIFDGIMSHINVIDGTAYDASTFGSTDSTTGIWKPITAPSVTYGTNGFFLKFENSGAMGTDSSGNSNTFTVNGTMTQLIDTPSNVFATLNPLLIIGTTNRSITNGNTTFYTTSAAWGNLYSTLAFSSGKYYAEFKLDTIQASAGYSGAGIVDATYYTTTNDTIVNNSSTSAGVPFDHRSGQTRVKSATSTVTSNIGDPSNGDIYGFAADMDNKALYIHKNGTYIQINGVTGDPTSGATKTGAVTIPAAVNDCMFFVSSYTSDATISSNFGNGYFGTTAVSSAQNPDDGIGIFEYDVPTGYRALCTKSINAEEYS